MKTRFLDDLEAVSILPKFCRHMYIAYRKIFSVDKAFEKTMYALSLYEQRRLVRVGW